MKKLVSLAVLLAVSLFTLGCNETPAQKQAKDVQKADEAMTDADKAVDEGEMKKEKIDDATAKKVGKDLNKAADDLEDAAEQDTK